MKKILLVGSLMLSGLVYQAQQASDVIKKAESALSSYNYEKAIELYGDVLKAEPNNNEAKERLASLYLAPTAVQNENMATRLFGEVYSTGTMSPASQIKYANLLQSQKDFDKASAVYNNYMNRASGSNSFIRNLSAAQYAKWAETNSAIVLKNIEDVNTKGSDFSPAYYRDGIALVSTRKNRTKTGFSSIDEVVNNFTDLFSAKKTDAKGLKFEEPNLLLKAANQKYMQGPMTFTDDYGVMYITRSITKDDKSVKSTTDNKTVLMEICRVNYSAGDINNWDEITPIQLFRGENYQNYSYAHPAFLNGKGDEMIFASNMPGGFGGTDLWYSKLVGTEWSTPINLGSEINTPGDEMFPFVAKDGSLFFASSGLPGLGGLDIFKAKSAGDIKYSGVENLGAPFNSKFDDFGFIVNSSNREGYLSSNRPGGKGLDDIYAWSTEETTLTVKVVAASTGEAIKNADVKIACLGGQKYRTDEMGQVVVTYTNLKNCDINASADGFKNNTLNVKNLQSNKLVVVPLEKDLEDRCKFVIVVLDKETKQPIPDANVVIRQTSTNEEAAGSTKADGTLRVKGIAMNEYYEISAGKDINPESKYIGVPESAICKGLKNGDSIVKYVYLTKAGKGTKIKIENIYYDLSKWNIRPEAAVELDKLVSLMRRYPTMEIELGSHTDCRSSMKFNEDLSSKRAAAAVEYLVNKGIESSRMTSKGYGESQLTNNCACEGAKKSTCPEKDHQANRRTEFTILKF